MRSRKTTEHAAEQSAEPAARSSHEPFSPWFFVPAFVVPGLTYPLWPFLISRGAVDPPGVWIAIGACFLAVPVVHLFRPMSKAVLLNVMSTLAIAVTVHLFLLASLNEMRLFYAAGSSIAVVATAIFIRSIRLLGVFVAVVLTLGTLSFLVEPNELKIATWGGMLPILFLAHQRLRTQLRQERALEEEVRSRTQQLEQTNQRLLDEIAERVRLEEELRVTHKMEAVGRLAGGVAHDFNNLLTTIGVYSELVRGGLTEDSPLRHEVEQIQKASQQAASLTQQLLTLGRRSHVQVERVDLNAVVSHAAPMLRHLLSSETQLTITLAKEPQPIWGNLDQLQQILINLAINARDAMQAAGTFEIETSRCTRQDLLGLEGVVQPESEEYVRLTVRDTGEGMTADARHRAFDPFFTTKDSDQGAGLGLAIVHGIVSQADGYVHLESEPGEGARFELYWPVASQREEPADLSSNAPVLGRSERILLVEDEEDLRHALVRVLTSGGYNVTGCAGGMEALEVVERETLPFDLLVTDVVMPRMNGFELAARIAELQPQCRTLLVSGHLNDGAIDHLPSHMPLLAKPFSPEELTGRVRELLDEGR